jgi:hypothetical protein
LIVAVLVFPALMIVPALFGRSVVLTCGALKLTFPAYGTDSARPPTGLVTSTTNRQRPGAGSTWSAWSAFVA